MFWLRVGVGVKDNCLYFVWFDLIVGFGFGVGGGVIFLLVGFGVFLEWEKVIRN